MLFQNPVVEQGGSGDEVINFCQKYFTDVDTDPFRSRLPMPLDGFVSHVERTANAVRDTLREYWITAASAKLRLYLATMREDGAFATMAEENGAMAPAAVEVGGSGLPGADDGTRAFDQWFEQTNGPGMKFGDGAGGPGAGSAGSSIGGKQLLQQLDADKVLGDDAAAKELAESAGEAMTEQTVLNTAAMLMSQQLRSNCESSTG